MRERVLSEMSSREREEFEQEKEIAILQGDYQLKYREMDLEIKRLEMKWTQVFRLPAFIILLPVKLIAALGLLGYAVRKSSPPEKYWEFLTRY